MLVFICMDTDRSSAPHLFRFTSWLGNYSSANKQRRLMGELHARMLVSGSCCTDRVGLRTGHLPALRSALVKPLIDNEKDGIADVVSMMQVDSRGPEVVVYLQCSPFVLLPPPA